jgi:hypothetical protein
MTLSHIPSPKSQVPSPKSQVLNPKSQVPLSTPSHSSPRLRDKGVDAVFDRGVGGE